MFFHSVRQNAGGNTSSHDGLGTQNQDNVQMMDASVFNGLPSATAAADAAAGAASAGAASAANLGSNYADSSSILRFSEKFRRFESLISDHLSQLNVESAVFVSELLLAECSTLDELSRERAFAHYLYSLSLYMNDDFHTAMRVSSERRHDNLGCAYVYARCCLRLKSNYSDALDGLLSLQYSWESVPSIFGYPKKSTVCLLAGKLFKVLDHESKGETYLRYSLDGNPYLWEASKELCALRSHSVLTVFKKPADSPIHATNTDSKSRNKPHTPFKAPSRSKQNLSNSQTTSLLSASNIGISVSPHFFKKARFTTTPTTATSNANATSTDTSAIENRHIGTTTPSKLSGTDSHAKLRSSMDKKILTNPHQAPRVGTVDSNLDELFSYFIRIEYCKLRYDSFKAIRMMHNRIPAHIISSMPWCLSTLGKLHFELVNYEMAKSYFSKLRSLQPTRFEDMDIFSTVLWHLQDKITLSALCAELLTLDKYNPVAWCSLGNLHSLNKDHDEAITAFGKAIQLNPFFAYAYTLQGHEYSNSDAFDNAKSCFRKALTIEKTHYNALYGLGMCCVKLGKFEEALLFFEKARGLNPVNVILNCCCGVALERLQQPERALNFYELANELQPNSSLALFKKSQLLLNMGQYSSALQNFKKLETLTPDEAHVHFLLGNLYQIVGKKQDAMNQYTIAMNLDPKGSQLIKEAMEKCHEQG
ncbi:unnamed protein product [Kluyveromyces dobzhanskii CBS 2104]|uniref:WGS project CCBQ000000000 data, contig 00011 n=1 Tax=Kluyveromyces dobzhanskii CBS 2104 TaxID=1427455 RepID=A0A0A8LA26_9SACH|nr:unnamed protein product [Kluyveromyces dobzhanskii CBS 2104]